MGKKKEVKKEIITVLKEWRHMECVGVECRKCIMHQTEYCTRLSDLIDELEHLERYGE